MYHDRSKPTHSSKGSSMPGMLEFLHSFQACNPTVREPCSKSPLAQHAPVQLNLMLHESCNTPLVGGEDVVQQPKQPRASSWGPCSSSGHFQQCKYNKCNVYTERSVYTQTHRPSFCACCGCCCLVLSWEASIEHSVAVSHPSPLPFKCQPDSWCKGKFTLELAPWT